MHSFKGGTGKSLIASALAHTLSLSRPKEKVLVIDCDFSAPSLHSFFGKNLYDKNIMQFLMGTSSISELITSTDYSNLDLILAPHPHKGREILKMDARWHAKALQNMLEAINTLTEELKYSWVIFDNQSGVSMTSINFLTLSTSSIISLRPSKYAIEGVFNQSKTIFRKLSLLVEEGPRKDYLVWNQVPIESLKNDNDGIMTQINSWNKKFSENLIIPLGIIPYNHKLAVDLFLCDKYDLNELSKYLVGIPEKIISSLTGD
ncbi:MAG: ParA family protein [Candidatus Hodarchaeales archaeon]